MANINVTRNTTDTADNVKYTTPVNHIDYRGITLLISVIFSALTILWLTALGLASFGCWYSSNFTCKETSVIFWGYITFIFISALFAIYQSIPAIRKAVENMEYKYWRGVITHRDEIRTYAKDIIAVAQQSAKSEATAGMDNYSPSIDHSVKNDVTPTNIATDGIDVSTPFSKIPIELISESEL